MHILEGQQFKLIPTEVSGWSLARQNGERRVLTYPYNVLCTSLFSPISSPVRSYCLWLSVLSSCPLYHTPRLNASAML